MIETPTTETPTGRPTKESGLIEKRSPGAFYDGDDSSNVAAIKVGFSLVVVGTST